VLNTLFDDRYGGPQKRVIQVAKKLLLDNIDTVVCLPDRGGDTSAIAEDAGLPVRRLNYSKIPNPKSLRQLFLWLLFLPRDTYRFKKLFTKENPDIVHINGALFIQPAIAAKLSGLPLVWHLNDTIVPGKVAWLFGKFVRSLATKIIVAADAVAHHYGIENKYSIVYAPVDIEKFKNQSKWENENSTSHDEVRVGLIANWNPNKGIEYFIQAAVELSANNYQKYKFVLAGNKVDTQLPYAASLERQIKASGLEEDIEVLGFVSSVENVLKNLDILVLSSISEACPMAILEAMAAGVPVVATDVGGVRELLSPDTEYEAGKVVAARDPHALASAIADLVGNKEKYMNMARNGRESASKRFSLQVCASKHRDIYNSCLQQM